MRFEKQPNRSGYVLLGVLAVMVLLVTVLATLSKLSLRRALAAADAQVRLQQRLGADSIEKAILPQAGKVFDMFEQQAEQREAETGQFEPVQSKLRYAITFGGVTFDMLLADEDAKLNLNEVFQAVGPERTQTIVSKIVGPAAARSIRLAPATKRITELKSNADQESEEETTEETPRAFRSWGEVFDVQKLSGSMGSDAALPNVTADLTCWGGGSLHLRRASDTAAESAASAVLSDAGAKRLLRRYKESPEITLGILIQREAKTETQRMSLRRMIGGTSTHYSLWIDASATARRSIRTFSVMQQTEDGTVTNERFAF